MTDVPSTNGPDSSAGVEHTPEEIAQFEARAETVAGYATLAEANLQTEAAAGGNRSHLNRLLYGVVALVMALILAYALFYGRGIDTLAGIDDGNLSSEMEKVAPPEPAATPTEVLPAAVFTFIDEDHEIAQVPLEVYGDAKYSFAYEAGPSRLAVFTGLDAAEYENLVVTAESRPQTIAPVELEGVGDEAILFSGKVIFKAGEDCGVISGIPRQDSEGEEYMSLTPEELESLARIAAPRM